MLGIKVEPDGHRPCLLKLAVYWGLLLAEAVNAVRTILARVGSCYCQILVESGEVMRSALGIEGRLVVKSILEEFIIHVSRPSTTNISYWLLDLSLPFHSSASMESKLSLRFLRLLWETLLDGLQITSFFSAFCQMLLYLFSWHVKVIVLLFSQRLLSIVSLLFFQVKANFLNS